MTHTPGPWKVRCPNGRSSVWTEAGCKVASVEAPDCVSAFMESGRAGNARLIAAAPDLLEACKESLTFWHEGKEGMTQLQYHAGVDRVEKLLRAAIQKAAGR